MRQDLLQSREYRQEAFPRDWGDLPSSGSSGVSNEATLVVQAQRRRLETRVRGVFINEFVHGQTLFCCREWSTRIRPFEGLGKETESGLKIGTRRPLRRLF